MTTFKEARAIAKAKFGDTLPEGYEDQEDFNVLPVSPLIDQVVLVTKATGALHTEVYFDVEDKLVGMSTVTDE